MSMAFGPFLPDGVVGETNGSGIIDHHGRLRVAQFDQGGSIDGPLAIHEGGGISTGGGCHDIL
jgi:hypothetical protein